MSPDRVGEVRRALSAVTDPELDQSVVDLGFIADVRVDGGAVAVDYRLPTYWCSANFAWIMSEDMRNAVAGLDWVTRVEVRLVDHFAAARINAGVATGERFGSSFKGAGPDIDLAALRETFRRKAFLGRMSALIDALRQRGSDDAAILALTIAQLGRIQDAGLSEPVARYLDLRQFYGGPAGPDDPAFRTLEGLPIDPAGLRAYLRDIRLTRRGAEANGEMCRMLLRARLQEPALETPVQAAVP